MVMLPNASNSRISRGRRGPLNIGKRGAAAGGPTLITAPVLSTDIAYVGTTLTVSTGIWEGVEPITYSYQWQDTNGAVFVDILGENTNTYTANTGDIGYRVRCEVIATDANGSTRAFSNITYAVSASVAPVNTALPTITGSPVVGQTVSLGNGVWTGTPTPSISRQLLRNGTAISGATGTSYTFVDADLGADITLRVRGTNVAGFADATSAVFGPIDAPAIDWNWQPFTVRTGDSGEWLGYSNGDIVSPPFNPPVGSITGEPTAVTQLEAIFQDASGDVVVVFQGDWRADLSDLGMTFGGEALVPQGYSLQGGNTFLRFSGYSGTLTVDTDYPVEFAFMLSSALNRDGENLNSNGANVRRLHDV